MESKNIEVQIKHRYHMIPVGGTDSSKTYRAQDLLYERDVFIKEIDVSIGDQKDALRFAEEEAKAMIEVGRKSTHVPVVYEYFYERSSRMFYIVMQLIIGKTLTETMKENTGRSKQDVNRFLKNLSDVCDVLQLMYRYGYYHKDIKPDNIMISADREGRTYLIDFGSTVKKLALYNDGTLDYRAPEMSQQMASADCTRADVFSLGVILYEFFTGKRPQSGVDYKKGRANGPNEWNKFIEPVEIAPEIPSKINQMIIKCMKKDPKERYDIRSLKNVLLGARTRG